MLALLGRILAVMLAVPFALPAQQSASPGPASTLGLPLNPTAADIFRVRVFEDPLVPIGGEPSAAENRALTAALDGYARRKGPDDFSSLTGFLEQYPSSPWGPSLLTGLGMEYYNTAHYSLALEAWRRAWTHADEPQDAAGFAIMNRAAGELAFLYARLGRMTELESFFTSVKGRSFSGPATERIVGAREGLWNMKNRPEVSFRCGPLALHRVKLMIDPQHPCTEIINASASTQKGFSLPQVAQLSKKIGLNYRMAFRNKDAPFVVPSVVHWKVGHYAALVRQVGDRYLVQDPTFRNDVWATQQALEQEASGYYLIPDGPLPSGWRPVEANEGGDVWGKGQTSSNDPGPITPRDIKKGPAICSGMAVPTAHMMAVNLSLADNPLGYVPPVGPAVEFTLRYNHRDAYQPSVFSFFNEGDKWTSDWLSYIVDNPQSPMADVSCYVGGGGLRTFTGFDTNTQTFVYQLYDQTRLTRTGGNSYEMLWPDGAKLIFNQSDGSIGTSRKIFLTQILDPQGNALTLTYDTNLLLVAVTDAIGQVTTLTYGLPAGTVDGIDMPADPYKLIRVTDPFGRFASFDYRPVQIGETFFIFNGQIMDLRPMYAWALSKITDVIGLTSQFTYVMTDLILQNNVERVYRTFINSLVTPYGTTTFSQGSTNTTRWLETRYPDGSRDRVEFNQTVAIQSPEPDYKVPVGMGTVPNGFLESRNTFYWSRNACATAYGDYFKATIYHWLHASDISSCSGILESLKKPLEARLWLNYVDSAGQFTGFVVGPNNQPAHAGRVLDDGTSQVHSFAYNAFGHVTNMIDPVGRTYSYVYDTNGIDLLEIRQTRAGNNELLFRARYNSQHLPMVTVDAAGQTNTYAYNSRGQILATTNAKGETTTFTYDPNGYLTTVDGPLPGPVDVASFTYDAFGRMRTSTSISGYTLIFDYDNFDRITRVTHPDSTFEQITYDRLDPSILRDRAGRQTFLEHDNMRQLTKNTDPLGRSTLFQWCSCGSLKSLIDPLGHMTSWLSDVQGRPVAKKYSDGSQINYTYEKTTSRLRQISDEKLENASFTYNLDNTVSFVAYANTTVPTPDVSFTYDPNYERVASITDGAGTRSYSYVPINSAPALGAGRVATVHGPRPDETITYQYDELGRRVVTAINGVAAGKTFDAAGRILGITNALGAFSYAYDGSSPRLLSESFPNGQTMAVNYGNSLQDFALQQVSYRAGATPISQFDYNHDISKERITNWSQQAGVQPPSISYFGYDDADQLTSVTVTNNGTLAGSFGYGYDTAGNRVSEQVNASTKVATYNSLNQISTSTAPGTGRTNEWDAANRLVAVNAGNQRTEFSYDGRSRLLAIRQLINGSEVSHRLFVWSGGRMVEERGANGAPTKRFFHQGVQLLAGTNAGSYYYTRDHLGSIRELTDSAGAVRARYAYDPFGRRTKISGDLEADFGFAGMFWSAEVNLCLTHFRAYDPELGRWLSRDPLNSAEIREGPNLYAYAANNPVNLTDPSGLQRWTPEFMERMKGILTPGQYQELLDKKNGTGRYGPGPLEPPPRQVTDTALRGEGDLALRGEGDLALRDSGDLALRGDGEIMVRPKGDIAKWVPPEEVPPVEKPRFIEPEPPAPRTRTFPGFSGAFTEFIGAGITILTMTDCDTVGGIFALMRVRRGELLNQYENQMMKDLKELEGW